MSTGSDDTTTPAEAARRAWANNLKSEWERRGAHEEEHSFDPPSGPPPPAPSPAPTPTTFRPSYNAQPGLNRSYSYSQRYRPASSENIAAAARDAARRHAEETSAKTLFFP
ncbi:hypothetical protein FRC12_004107 [Ceratobasidium sp. 428]|nr:hypothetical protein FRC12_004107 [Ceratobasidium sp. 428]